MFTGHKAFLFRKGTRDTILTIALVVAVLASLAAFVNAIVFRSRSIGKLGGGPSSAVIVGDAAIQSRLLRERMETSSSHILPGSVIPAWLEVGGEDRAVFMVSTNVSEFVRVKNADLEGEIAEEGEEADVGRVLARMANIEIGDDIRVKVGGEKVELHVVGIVSAHTQADVEVLVPEGFMESLAPSDNRFFTVEVRFAKNISGREAIASLANAASKGVDVVGMGQAAKFIEEVDSQTVSFLEAWSLIVYAVVAAVSGVGTMRLVNECERELEILRSIGASRRKVVGLLLLSVSGLGFVGSLIGISLGIVGSQVVSTGLGWIKPGVELSPFLGLGQTLKMLTLATGSSVFGGLVSSFVVLRGFEV